MEIVGKAPDPAPHARIEVDLLPHGLFLQLIRRIPVGEAEHGVQADGVVLVDQILQIQLVDQSRFPVEGLRREPVSQFAAERRGRRIGFSRPVIPDLGRVDQAGFRIADRRRHVKVQSGEEEIILSQLVGQCDRTGFRMRLPDIRFDALDLPIGLDKGRLEFHFIEPPFLGLQASPDQEFPEVVVIPPDFQAFHVRRFHRVAVVGIGVAAAYAKDQAGAPEVPLENRLRLVHVEGLAGVTQVGVMVGVFFQDDVHGTAHRRAAELGRNHALVDFDPVDHVHRDVVEIQEIRLVVHGGVVQEEADPLPFQAAHGQP